jgi:hypothetical protein
MASVISNNSPECYAHPLTGNNIRSKDLEPLFTNIPVPFHWLGEAICIRTELTLQICYTSIYFTLLNNIIILVKLF